MGFRLQAEDSLALGALGDLAIGVARHAAGWVRWVVGLKNVPGLDIDRRPWPRWSGGEWSEGDGRCLWVINSQGLVDRKKLCSFLFTDYSEQGIYSADSF